VYFCSPIYHSYSVQFLYYFSGFNVPNEILHCMHRRQLAPPVTFARPDATGRITPSRVEPIVYYSIDVAHTLCIFSYFVLLDAFSGV
jgi:hypothetical protein